jgi:hypothetical protein
MAERQRRWLHGQKTKPRRADCHAGNQPTATSVAGRSQRSIVLAGHLFFLNFDVRSSMLDVGCSVSVFCCHASRPGLAAMTATSFVASSHGPIMPANPARRGRRVPPRTICEFVRLFTDSTFSVQSSAFDVLPRRSTAKTGRCSVFCPAGPPPRSGPTAVRFPTQKPITSRRRCALSTRCAVGKFPEIFHQTAAIRGSPERLKSKPLLFFFQPDKKAQSTGATPCFDPAGIQLDSGLEPANLGWQERVTGKSPEPAGWKACAT